MIYAGRGMRAGAIYYALLDGLVVARFFWREVAIGFAFFNQLPRGDPMLLGVVGLKDDLFVEVKSEPFQSVDDRARRFVGRALQIRVFDAQQKFASDLARIQPIEQRRARRPDVQIAGR